MQIKKFTVQDYILITRDCKDVAKAIMLLDSKDKQEQANAFGDVVATALPQVVQVIALATGQSKEDIEKMDDIDVIIDYLFQIVEVNDFLSIKKRLVEKFTKLKN